MSNIPDFATAAYPEVKAGGQSPAPRTETWVTNEQIPVPPTYSESVYDDCLHLDFTAGVAPNLRGPYATKFIANQRFPSRHPDAVAHNDCTRHQANQGSKKAFGHP